MCLHALKLLKKVGNIYICLNKVFPCFRLIWLKSFELRIKLIRLKALSLRLLFSGKTHFLNRFAAINIDD